MVDRLHVDGVPAVREALGLDAASADTAAAGTSQLSVCTLQCSNCQREPETGSLRCRALPGAL